MIGDVLKVWIYALMSLFLGAWAAPGFYNAGKALAEVSMTKRTNAPLEWLAARCQAAEFSAFFQLSWAVAAAALFLPFIHSLRGGQPSRGTNAWQFRLPSGARSRAFGQPLRNHPHRASDALRGFFGVTGLLGVVAGVLTLAGIFEVSPLPESSAMMIFKFFIGAVAFAVISEFLFRGVAMGIFLRAMTPPAAIAMSAVFSAMVLFFAAPHGLNVVDLDASGNGFELLRKTAGKFSDFRWVMGFLTPLVALGVVLGYARWRSASLFLPIGISIGWNFFNAVFDACTVSASHAESVVWILLGSSLKQGPLPLLVILISGIFVSFTRREHEPFTET